ncbi:hypothetical protein M3J09_013579 [Ascochyta lentis]
MKRLESFVQPPEMSSLPSRQADCPRTLSFSHCRASTSPTRPTQQCTNLAETCAASMQDTARRGSLCRCFCSFTQDHIARRFSVLHQTSNNSIGLVV